MQCTDLTKILRHVVSALDKRCGDPGHSNRVTICAVRLAEEMRIPSDILQQIYWGALLHDIGKIWISDQVLQKPGPLTEIEWNDIRSHPMKGFELLEPVGRLETALDIILYHHERFDGKGYPFKLSGKEIPLTARLFSVVDAFDAMTNLRPYKQSLTHEKAVNEIRLLSGQQFDPEIVQVFMEVMTKPTPIIQI